MIDERGTFEQVAKFLHQSYCNNKGLQKAIDAFIERLAECEKASIMPGSGTPSDPESMERRRSPAMREFHKAIERFSVATIQANQALLTASLLAKSISEEA